MSMENVDKRLAVLEDYYGVLAMATNALIEQNAELCESASKYLCSGDADKAECRAKLVGVLDAVVERNNLKKTLTDAVLAATDPRRN